MKKIIILCLSLMLTGCASAPVASFDSWDANVGNVDMYHELMREDNFVFSPYSIKDCFYTLYSVSKGDSKDEMEEVFGFEEEDAYRKYDKTVTSDKNNPLLVANRAFLNEDKVEFVNEKALKDIDVEAIDMSDSKKAAKHINKFITDNTDDMIKDLVTEDKIDESTTAVLVNAMYFDSKWDNSLNIGDYHLRWEDGYEYSAFAGKAPVKNLKILEEYDVDVLRLPYNTKSGKYSLYILCDRNSDHQVDEMMEEISDEELDEILDFSDYSAKDLKNCAGCVFKVPDFEMEYRESVNNYLQNIGLNAPFDPTTTDFDKFAKMYVSEVIHGSKITVDEEGTQAAAATVIETKEMVSENGGGGKEPIYVTVDSPFVFVLKDDANNIDLFMGRINTPSSIIYED